MIRVSPAEEVCPICGGPFVTTVLTAICDVWTIRTGEGPKVVLTNPRHGYHRWIAWNSMVPERGVQPPVP